MRNSLWDFFDDNRVRQPMVTADVWDRVSSSSSASCPPVTDQEISATKEGPSLLPTSTSPGTTTTTASKRGEAESVLSQVEESKTVSHHGTGQPTPEISPALHEKKEGLETFSSDEETCQGPGQEGNAKNVPSMNTFVDLNVESKGDEKEKLSLLDELLQCQEPLDTQKEDDENDDDDGDTDDDSDDDDNDDSDSAPSVRGKPPKSPSAIHGVLTSGEIVDYESHSSSDSRDDDDDVDDDDDDEDLSQSGSETEEEERDAEEGEERWSGDEEEDDEEENETSSWSGASSDDTQEDDDLDQVSPLTSATASPRHHHQNPPSTSSDAIEEEDRDARGLRRIMAAILAETQQQQQPPKSHHLRRPPSRCGVNGDNRRHPAASSSSRPRSGRSATSATSSTFSLPSRASSSSTPPSRPASSSAASSASRHRPGSSFSATFTPRRVEEIEKENQRLLKQILRINGGKNHAAPWNARRRSDPALRSYAGNESRPRYWATRSSVGFARSLARLFTPSSRGSE